MYSGLKMNDKFTQRSLFFHRRHHCHCRRRCSHLLLLLYCCCGRCRVIQCSPKLCYVAHALRQWQLSQPQVHIYNHKTENIRVVCHTMLVLMFVANKPPFCKGWKKNVNETNSNMNHYIVWNCHCPSLRWTFNIITIIINIIIKNIIIVTIVEGLYSYSNMGLVHSSWHKSHILKRSMQRYQTYIYTNSINSLMPLIWLGFNWAAAIAVSAVVAVFAFNSHGFCSMLLFLLSHHRKSRLDEIYIENNKHNDSEQQQFQWHSHNARSTYTEKKLQQIFVAITI